MNNGLPTKNYKHLQESIRLKIATDYLRHEMRKIFPSIRNKKIWKIIDEEIINLPNNKTMAPVRDFWNFVDAICFGLKLKNLVPRLTSQNIKWSVKKIDLDDLYLGSKKDFACLKTLKIDMPNGRQIKDFLFNPKNIKILKFAKKDSLINSKKTFDRDNDLIIVGEKDGKIMVYDGNRRVIKNILNGNDKISAYIASTVKQPMFYNYWVPTSQMLNLVSWAGMNLKNDNKKASKCLSQAVGYLIKFSAIGKAEFHERVINNASLYGAEHILKEVNKIVK
jgi:hypothetical protein